MSVWWVLIPDGDVYPLEVACPPLRAYHVCDDDGTPGEGARERQVGVSRLPSFVGRSVHWFLLNRQAGPPAPLLTLRAIEEARNHEEAVAGPRLRRRPATAGAPRALLGGQVRRIVYFEKDGDEQQGGVVPEEDLFGGVSRGGLTLYEKGGVARVARAVGEGEIAPAGRGAEEDIRILPVRWTV